jgi:hypothetical protein
MGLEWWSSFLIGEIYFSLKNNAPGLEMQHQSLVTSRENLTNTLSLFKKGAVSDFKNEVSAIGFGGELGPDGGPGCVGPGCRSVGPGPEWSEDEFR